MIRVYFPGDHPGKFVGIRVAVSVNAKLRQKYYSFNHHDILTGMKMATALEQTWLADQAYYQQDRVFSRSSNTGIAGVQLTHYVSNKPYGAYVYRRLTVQLCHNNERSNKSWHLQSDTVPANIWKEACTIVHSFKNASDAILDQMIQSKPTDHQVRSVYAKLPLM